MEVLIHMKKFSIVLVLIFAICTTVVVSAGNNTVKVVLNGNQLVFDDVNPIIENGRTLVPLRKIFESLGAKVTWQEATRTVIGEKGSLKVILQIGNKEAYVNNEKITLDVPAKIIDNRTVVPLRFVSESLGTVVNWDGNTYTVKINTPKLLVSFLDVGQADCALIQTPGNKNILIDAGNDADKEIIINYLRNSNISKINALIATHHHEDHIGAMDDIINAFNVDNIYMSKATNTSNTYNNLIKAINYKGLSINTLITQ
jgi:competence protein ComEC